MRECGTSWQENVRRAGGRISCQAGRGLAGCERVCLVLHCDLQCSSTMGSFTSGGFWWWGFGEVTPRRWARVPAVPACPIRDAGTPKGQVPMRAALHFAAAGAVGGEGSGGGGALAAAVPDEVGERGALATAPTAGGQEAERLSGVARLRDGCPLAPPSGHRPRDARRWRCRQRGRVQGGRRRWSRRSVNFSNAGPLRLHFSDLFDSCPPSLHAFF